MTQAQLLITHLQTVPYVTSRSAMIKLGIVDLPKVVSDILKKHPDLIRKREVEGTNHFGKKTRYKAYSINRDALHLLQSQPKKESNDTD